MRTSVKVLIGLAAGLVLLVPGPRWRAQLSTARRQWRGLRCDRIARRGHRARRGRQRREYERRRRHDPRRRRDLHRAAAGRLRRHPPALDRRNRPGRRPYSALGARTGYRTRVLHDFTGLTFLAGGGASDLRVTLPLKQGTGNHQVYYGSTRRRAASSAASPSRPTETPVRAGLIVAGDRFRLHGRSLEFTHYQHRHDGLHRDDGRSITATGAVAFSGDQAVVRRSVLNATSTGVAVSALGRPRSTTR